MLNVDRSENADASGEQVEHVFIALLVLGAGNIRMRQFIDETNFRLARDDAIDVHLFHHDVTIADLLAGDGLQVFDLCLSAGATVSFNEANDDVITLLAEQVSVFEHLVGLADARRCANVDAQARMLRLLQLGEQRFGAGSVFSSSAHGCSLNIAPESKSLLCAELKLAARVLVVATWWPASP